MYNSLQVKSWYFFLAMRKFPIFPHFGTIYIQIFMTKIHCCLHQMAIPITMPVAVSMNQDVRKTEYLVMFSGQKYNSDHIK